MITTHAKLIPVHFETNFKEVLEKAFNITINNPEEIFLFVSVHNKYKIYAVNYFTENDYYTLRVHDKFKTKLGIRLQEDYKETRKKKGIYKYLKDFYIYYDDDYKKMIKGFKFYLKNMKYIGQDDKAMRVIMK